jgi:serine/threonine-protein kinase
MQHEVLAPGFVVAGKYVIERTLGRGGMGAVYVVSHATTGKRLALKVLLPEFVHNADIVSRFLREAQVMGRLQHRHVVDVFDVGRDGDVLYIVMALLDGKPLGDLLHDATLTLEEALVILLRAMEGIAAAHDLGIVHRDIKPDNIFVCIGASGRLDDPRVLDFGISKLDDGTSQLTRSGVAMGTPYYMSIEQLNGQRDLDQRVDVYAMGVILYEAISGTPPYTADSISALAIRVLTTTPDHLGQLRPDLPAGLADVVMKALAKNRDDRFRSMRQLIEALRPFVPASGGLLVPEGSGRLLRTPGGGRGAVPESSAVRAREVGDEGTPAPRAAAPARSVGKLTAVALLILLVSGAGAWLMRERRAPAQAALPQVDAVAPAALPEPAPGATTQPAMREGVAERPAQEPVAPAHEAVRSRAADPDASQAKARNTASRPRAAALRAKEVGASAPLPTPAVEPASPAPAVPSPRKSAEGRAGKLGSDEF